MGKKADQKLEKRLRKQFEQENVLHNREVQKRITTLEADAKAAKADAIAAKQVTAKAEMNSALDRALGSIPWESNNSRDLARNFFAPLVKRDEDTGEFMIEGVALETFIMAEIPERFPNLMASKTKTASGAQPGTGTGSKPAKPAPIDFDALTSQSTKAELEAAAKHLASVLALSN